MLSFSERLVEERNDFCDFQLVNDEDQRIPYLNKYFRSFTDIPSCPEDVLVCNELTTLS